MKRKKLLIILGGVLFVGIGVTLMIYQAVIVAHLDQLITKLSPKVQSIVVESAGTIDKNDVVKRSGIAVGMPLVYVDSEMAAKQIARHPQISGVSVHRKLSGSVAIGVTLRKPAVIIASSRLSYADESGVIFKLLAPGDNLNFPVITGITTDGPETPRQRQIIKGALALITEIESAFAAELPVAEVHIDSGNGYSFFSENVGGEIIVGMPPFENRISRLKTIISRMPDKLLDIENIDLDYNKKAFVRFKHREGLFVAQSGSFE